MPLLPALEFTRPLGVLLLAAMIPALILMHRISRAYLPGNRRRVALGVRLTVAILRSLAIAGPLLRGPADRVAVAFLVDRSDSISAEARLRQEEWLRQALAAMSGEDRASVIVFGTEPLMERQLSGDRALQQIGSFPPAGRTDLAAAIRLGMASLPSTWARKLIVLSDGNENLGNLLDEAALVHAAGVPISVVPVAVEAGSEVLVRDVQAPSVLREGESFTATVALESTGNARVKLHLTSDGQVVGSQELDLTPGLNSIVFAQAPLEKGFHSLQVQVETENDTFAENNQGGAFMVVQGRPNVLVVEDQNGQGRFIADALESAGLSADLRGVAAAPLTEASLRSYDSVVLVNMPAPRLSESQLLAIQSYVRDFGGGLVVVGGPESFTVGSYSRTPLEETLPVRMELQGRTAAASVALVLAIDSSGSMAGGPFGASKMDLAKEAAASAAELLGEYDRIGVIAFEETPRWAVEIQPVSDLGKIHAEISAMAPGGGTNVYPAVDEAYRSLATLDAKVKHVILLSDGITPGSDWDELTFRYNQANITLSTIAIGSDADYALMRSLAEAGGGRFYEGNDPFDLPRLVIKETQQVARAAIVEEPFIPLQVTSSPMMDGLGAEELPTLRGYVSTTPKPATQVVLVSAQGDPLLSEWQYGLGRAVAWTSDGENKWSADWVDWPEFSRFWAQVVKRTLPPPIDPNRQISVVQDGGDARVVVDAATEDRAFLNFARTSANVTRPDGSREEVALIQSAPGRYEGRFAARSEGSYFVEVLQRDAAGLVLSNQPGGYVVPYSAEYRERQTNTRLLTEVARVTGGAVLDDPLRAFAHDQRAPGQPLELWPWLLALAAILFLFDVAVRRLRMSWTDLRPLFRRVPIVWSDAQSPASAVGTFIAPRQRTRQDTPLPRLNSAAPLDRETAAAEVAAAPDTPTGRLLQAKRRARSQPPGALLPRDPSPPEEPPAERQV